jgi:tetrapyrrole methylase family protein/MazG family protein
VNVARFVEACPEDALRRTIDKFMARFRYIESVLDGQGVDLGRATFGEMDALWEKAKALGASLAKESTEGDG